MEVTPGGAQVVAKNIDPGGAGAGDLFGLAVKPHHHAVYFVDDRHQHLRTASTARRSGRGALVPSPDQGARRL